MYFLLSLLFPLLWHGVWHMGMAQIWTQELSDGFIVDIFVMNFMTLKIISVLCVSYILTSVYCCNILGTTHAGLQIFSERKMEVLMLLHQISLVFYWMLLLCQGKLLKKWTWFWQQFKLKWQTSHLSANCSVSWTFH